MKNPFKKSSTPKPPVPAALPEVRTAPLSYSMLNGWHAEAVTYVEGSSAASIFFRNEKENRTCAAGLDLNLEGSRIPWLIDRRECPAFGTSLHVSQLSGLTNRASTAIEGDIMDRRAEANAANSPKRFNGKP